MTVPEFMSEFMALLTIVSEDVWGTWKDPSNLQQKETSLRNYAKKPQMQKNIAKKIVHDLSLDNLKERISEIPSDSLKMMADDLKAYVPDVSADTVADTMCQILKEHIQTAAGLIKQDELEHQKQEALDKELKSKYGKALLVEENNECPFNGCGRSLVRVIGAETKPVYEVCMIDKSGPKEINNLLAMCPEHHATYILDNRKSIAKDMKTVKRALVSHNVNRMEIDETALVRELPRIVKGVTKAIEIDDKEPSEYDPKKIEQKIDKNKEKMAFKHIHNLAIENYDYVHTVLRRLEKQNVINIGEVQSQMRCLYFKASKRQKDKLQIFETIVDKVQRASKCGSTSCEIFVAYFVQICEVFDVIAK